LATHNPHALELLNLLSTGQMSQSAGGRAVQAMDMSERLSAKCLEIIEQQDGTIARWQVAGTSAGVRRGHLGSQAVGGKCVPSDAEITRDLQVIDGLVARARWQVLYRGVCTATSGSPATQSLLWAAVLRCGPDAALSHFSAAELDKILDRQTDATHVTVPGPSEDEVRAV
jgi:hypothetical protein